MAATSSSDGTRTVHRICPLCEACCGLELTVRGDQVLSIRGHDADVLSRGYICPKAIALKDLHHDPDRLRQPMIRVGNDSGGRASSPGKPGRLVQARWDDAWALIADRLPALIAHQGRNSVAACIGNPAAHKIGLIGYFPRLAKALGTDNLFSASTLDQMPKQLSSGLMFGGWLSIPVPDIARTDLLLILGGNPMASNGSLWTVPDFRGKAKALKARGGKLVVIDPRRTETAALADQHIAILPGTDVYMLGAMVQVLFAEGLVRTGRLTEHLAGVEAVRDALAHWTPEAVAGRCGVDAATIRQLARQLAAADKAAVYGRMGTSINVYGTLASWLLDVLNALTGHLDEPGGAMFSKAPAFATNTLGKPGVGRGVPYGRKRSRVSQAPEVAGEFPINCLAEEIETAGTGQVRGLITLATNPVLSAPNGTRLAAALDTLDFMVSVDIYCNETTRHADVILPGSSPLHDPHYDIAFPQFSWRNYARHSQAVFQRDAEHLPEWQIVLKLAAIAEGKGAAVDPVAIDDALFAEDVRRNAGPYAEQILAGYMTQPQTQHLSQDQSQSPLQGPDRLVDFAMRGGPYGDRFGLNPDGLNLAKLAQTPGGVDLGELQPRIPEILRTPSGKVELAPEMLLHDLQRAWQDLQTTAAPAPGSLQLIGRREVRSNNSWMHNLPTLAKGPQLCTALVHPDDATRLQLQHQQQAWMDNGRGQQICVQVEISDTMRAGVVCLPHGFGHDLPGAQLGLASQRPGANINLMFDERRRDPLSGNAELTAASVHLRPVV